MFGNRELIYLLERDRKETTLEEYIEEHINLILDAIRALLGETRVLEK